MATTMTPIKIAPSKGINPPFPLRLMRQPHGLFAYLAQPNPLAGAQPPPEPEYEGPEDDGPRLATDKTRSPLILPHFGHSCLSWAEASEASFSNLFPHSPQTYSYIGIFKSPELRILILT